MHSSILLLLPLLPVGVLLYRIWICIYNIFFHPLRNYPGPLLARATRLWNVYYDMSGGLHLKLKEMHDKYGEVVRIAPNELSYNTGRAWQDICGHRKSSKAGIFEKDASFYNTPPNGVKSILAATDDDHRRFRRLQSHAFSEKALLSQESIINHYVDLLISELNKRISGPEDGVVNMVHWFNFATFDIIGDLALGQSFGCLRDGIMHPFVSHIFEMIRYSVIARSFRRFTSPIKEILFAYCIPKNLIHGRAEQFAWCTTAARKRMAQGTERQDFMSYILRANDEKGMTPSEIESNAQLLITAGSETTATLLSGSTFYLLANPRVLNTLVEEIQNSFTSEDQITMQSTQHLPYLHAVLEESLRMFPPVPNTFPRTTPYPGETICGQFVPAGTSVGVHQYSAYHSARNFVEPDSFFPERFLGDPRFANDDKTAFNPFSFGPRNCLGKSLAYAEMRLILARVFWNFKLELQPESYSWNQMRTLMLWEKPPLQVKLARRLENES